ncbi:hypothetical protein AAG570_012229 [Ranatra chinensis]|uniref:Uncharacterized protein n=1 Tax=Ranatra chinensis TaxID=642074 RepID=A0ABD0Z4I4_9HEMI
MDHGPPSGLGLVLVYTFLVGISDWGILCAEGLTMGTPSAGVELYQSAVRCVLGLGGGLLADLAWGKWRAVALGTVAHTLFTAPLIAALGHLNSSYRLHVAYAVVNGITSFYRFTFVAFAGEQCDDPDDGSWINACFTVQYYLRNLTAVLGVLAAYRAVVVGSPRQIYWPCVASTVVAAVILVAFRFRFVVRPPWKGRFRDLFGCPVEAYRSRKRSRNVTFWIDNAADRYPEDGPRRDVGQLYALLPFLVLTLVFFFVRNSAEYILAGQVDRTRMVPEYEVRPFHVATLKAAVVVMLLPAVEVCVYPLAGSMGLLDSPMKRICSGCVSLAMMYFAAGTVECRLPPRSHPSHSSPLVSNFTSYRGILETSGKNFTSIGIDEFSGTSHYLLDFLDPTPSKILTIAFQLVFFIVGDLLHSIAFMTWVYSEGPPGLRATSVSLFYAMSPLADFFILTLPTVGPATPDYALFILGSLMIIVVTFYIFVQVTYKNQSVYE